MKNHTLILLGICVVGVLIRFINLSSLPPSLNWDEASHGYNAYSILKTGRDEWGSKYPMIFKAFGDYKLPVYIYLTVISEAIFGLNVFSVRFVSVLAGMIAIPITYLLTIEIFPNRKGLAVFSSAILATLPWHLFISRPALEANLSLTFIAAAILFLLKAQKKPIWLSCSALFFALALHTYNSARVFVPLYLIVYFLVSGFKGFKTKYFLTFIAIIIVSFIPIYVQLLSGEATARYDKLSILNQSSVFQIGQNRTNSHLPTIFAKFVYNRPVYFITEVSKNYLSYFSPAFFYQIDNPQTQFSIPGYSLITSIGIVLLLIGLYIFVSSKDCDKKVILSWFLLAPLPASITNSPPQAIRPIYLIIPLVIFISIALDHILQYKKKFFLIVFAVLIFEVVSYFFTLNSTYKEKYSQSWQYGYEQIYEYIKNHRSQYDNIFITKKYGEPHIFYAFFSKIDPTLMFPSFSNIRFKQSDWYWTDKLDGNVFFLNDWDIPTSSVKAFTLESKHVIPASKSLLITSPDHIPLNANKIETINFLDGSPAFIITSIP